MKWIFVASAFLALASAQYQLQSTFAGQTFFDNFVFYNSWDPTLGFVHYVTQDVAAQNGMLTITNETVSWGVDTRQTLNPSANLGRLSTRIYSVESWTHGLFVIDLSWSSCNEFVALSPGAFTESYWEINYIKIYQTGAGAEPSPSSSVFSVTPAISTSAVSTALSNAVGRSTTFTMSLAGTVPSVTTGSFTDTSSVLSVLSSLSTKSEASDTTTSTTSPPATRSATPSSSPTTVSIGPPVTATTPAISPVVVSSTTPLTTSIATSPTSSTQGAPPTLECSGYLCTSTTYVVVVQTVTVDLGALRTVLDHDLKLRADTPRSGLACDFTIPPKASPHHRTTDFACSMTRLEVFNGTLVTETIAASTAVHAREKLNLLPYLEIDSISISARSTRSLASPQQYAFTGSFRPTAAYIVSTVLTAHPSKPRAATKTSDCETPGNVELASSTGAASQIMRRAEGTGSDASIHSTHSTGADHNAHTGHTAHTVHSPTTTTSDASPVQITKTLHLTALTTGPHPHPMSSFPITHSSGISTEQTGPGGSSTLAPSTVLSTTYIEATAAASTVFSTTFVGASAESTATRTQTQSAGLAEKNGGMREKAMGRMVAVVVGTLAVLW